MSKLFKTKEEFLTLLENAKEETIVHVNLEKVIGIIKKNEESKCSIYRREGGEPAMWFNLKTKTYLKMEEENIPFIQKTNSGLYLITGLLVESELSSMQSFGKFKSSQKINPDLKNMTFEEYFVKDYPEYLKKLNEIQQRSTFWKSKRKEKQELLTNILNQKIDYLKDDLLAQIKHPHSYICSPYLNDAKYIVMQTFQPTEKVTAIYR